MTPDGHLTTWTGFTNEPSLPRTTRRDARGSRDWTGGTDRTDWAVTVLAGRSRFQRGRGELATDLIRAQRFDYSSARRKSMA